MVRTEHGLTAELCTATTHGLSADYSYDGRWLVEFDENGDPNPESLANVKAVILGMRDWGTPHPDHNS